jgi:hypothetical protein
VQTKWRLKNFKHKEMHRFDDDKVIKTFARWLNIEALISVLLTPLAVPLRQ